MVNLEYKLQLRAGIDARRAEQARKRELLEFQRSNPDTKPPRELLQVTIDPGIKRKRQEEEEEDEMELQRQLAAKEGSFVAALLPLATLRFRTKPVAVDSSTLSKLPPELLLRIASYPPPASAGAFSLCSKRLYALLAIPYLKCLHGHPPFSTAEFLRLLEPDLPDHIVCYYCEKLHKIKRLERHIKFTKRCDIPVNEAMRSYIHPRFSYVIFQMAMKRHRQGLDYSSPLKLLSYNEWSWIGPDEIKTSFRIVDGSLLLRQQHILLVHPNNDQMFTNTKIMICPHIKQLRGTINCQSSGMGRYNMVYTPGSIEIDHTPTAVECDCCAHQGKKDEGNWSGLVRCRDCATEFRVDTLGIGQSGKAYVVTRWKDLGEGRDANDSVWCAHMGEKGLLGGAGREAAGRSICVRFEGEGWRGGLESLVMPREMKR
ncbi:hypothetical protein VC83_03138 [Pseudogymnoascus destructans]|uniref:F-box domain-containing protein n=1 Tax=Pseudogymnoascus destructans TaxID=655981 RepID=A0A177ADT8_9PEZI|nr:uncharacterized protein VC83_03138 [Pseudogymnoascus destructans]OAF59960.1 hypothetical protein VC83_03138 [Pseudogymnoascus destructans]